jgi:hypothetical protein
MATKPLSEQLREAIQQCGKTRYRISKETGIAEAVLSRFVNRQAGMGWSSIDKLCECIGARLVLDAPATIQKAAKTRRRQKSR